MERPGVSSKQMNHDTSADDERQTSSGDTNAFTPSEMEAHCNRARAPKRAGAGTGTGTSANAKRRLSSGATNATLPPSEMQAHHQAHDARTRAPQRASTSANANANVAAERRPSPAAAAAAAEASRPSERKAGPPKRADEQSRAASKRAKTKPSSDGQARGPHRAAVRATLESGASDMLNLDIFSIGTSEEPPQHFTVSGADVPYTGPLKEVSLSQTHHDIGFKIHATVMPWGPEDAQDTSLGQPFLLQLFFDTNSDSVIFSNMTMARNKEVAVGASATALRPAPERSALPCFQQAILGVGGWDVQLGDRHVLRITVLPRRYVSIIPEAPEAPGAAGKPAKRPLELSQPDVSAAKRGKREGGPRGESNAIAVFQPAPPPPHDDSVRSISPAPADGNLRLGRVSGIRHALEQLRVGDTMKAVGRGEADYSLTRIEDIVVKESSLIFKAQHSGIPNTSTVVKVFRTTTDLVPNARTVDVATAARCWIREAKNHLRVSQHPSVVRLYQMDGRFLSLYMEHVASPDLFSYHEARANPLCTLSASDAETVLRNIADALKYIHGEGIVHNDIKPGNILYSKDRGAVLIDFGLSTDDQRVHSGGTPWYVPPEYLHHGHRGVPGDVFALGVVLLFLFRKIPLPELQVPRLHWLIADVRHEASPMRAGARYTMNKWLDIVKEASNKIPSVSDEPDAKAVSIVKKMLAAKPKDRISVDGIIEELQGLDDDAL
ncbi:hypothetical protein Trco_003658 [Trichoderma cornu-damae]|uniref:Protein kinase domain-containing protein n=1 Tax=Trichoderma cornu-damae TaxID=654480 RepID=A0A9P8QL08_9HYPO|nr:hypothetical protein Trco_003658 [Trichoderma cornu-damae]